MREPTVIYTNGKEFPLSQADSSTLQEIASGTVLFLPDEVCSEATFGRFYAKFLLQERGL